MIFTKLINHIATFAYMALVAFLFVEIFDIAGFELPMLLYWLAPKKRMIKRNQEDYYRWN